MTCVKHIVVVQETLLVWYGSYSGEKGDFREHNEADGASGRSVVSACGFCSKELRDVGKHCSRLRRQTL